MINDTILDNSLINRGSERDFKNPWIRIYILSHDQRRHGNGLNFRPNSPPSFL